VLLDGPRLTRVRGGPSCLGLRCQPGSMTGEAHKRRIGRDVTRAPEPSLAQGDGSKGRPCEDRWRFNGSAARSWAP
jgi:hypothetical protein